MIPLALGCVDKLEAAGIPAFGPTAYAAQMEARQDLLQNLMRKYGIPTAKSETFTEMDKALAYLDTQGAPIVVKADGLALGRGRGRRGDGGRGEAGRCGNDAGRQIRPKRRAGAHRGMHGWARSDGALFCDGKDVVPMKASQDHKRALDGDKGPNTGGMGAFAPSRSTPRRSRSGRSADSAADAPRDERGGLYVQGRALRRADADGGGAEGGGNTTRFGDPETQAVLPLLESDLFAIMRAVREQRLAETEIRWRAARRPASCWPAAAIPENTRAARRSPSGGRGGGGRDGYHAGTKRTDAGYVTAGGRVLGVTALGDTLGRRSAGHVPRRRRSIRGRAYAP